MDNGIFTPRNGKSNFAASCGVQEIKQRFNFCTESQSFLVSDPFLRNQKRIPNELSPLLCELCGVHIGDGHLGFREKKHEYLIQCTGNLKTDRDYYDIHLKRIWKELFNVDLKLKERKDNTYELRVYSKEIALFFNQKLGMPFGKKAKIIAIPKIIKDTCKGVISNEMKSCIRGIIDTDFYLVLDRKWIELGAWFASEQLVVDLHHYLTLFGIAPKIRLNLQYYNTSSQKYLVRHQIRIRRKDDIQRWFEEIGTNNPKIYKRYLKFRLLCSGGVDNSTTSVH